jgi:serine/threonine-protein kinase
MRPQLRQRLRRWLPFALSGASGFLLAFLIVGLWIFPSDAPTPDVTVPSVLGLPLDDATRRLKAVGLRGVVGARRFSGDAPRSTVLAQQPSPGDQVPQGTEISLDVSEGQQSATVPNLVGRSRDEAAGDLRSAGLALGDVSEQVADTARGVVLSSAPTAGQVVPLGTRVSIVMSAGPAELAMPDVVGTDQASARGMLEQLGLVIAPLEYDSLSTLAGGTVVSQTPSAGAAIASGSTVTLRIAGKP